MVEREVVGGYEVRYSYAVGVMELLRLRRGVGSSILLCSKVEGGISEGC